MAVVRRTAREIRRTSLVSDPASITDATSFRWWRVDGAARKRRVRRRRWRRRAGAEAGSRSSRRLPGRRRRRRGVLCAGRAERLGVNGGTTG
uniref:26S proteasome non-ATPase regulatory subunit 3 n=1 Tax=Arundo donax TaxID=35708 RepID=A0A0A9FRC7_ARUDO